MRYSEYLQTLGKFSHKLCGVLCTGKHVLSALDLWDQHINSEQAVFSLGFSYAEIEDIW